MWFLAMTAAELVIPTSLPIGNMDHDVLSFTVETQEFAYQAGQLDPDNDVLQHPFYAHSLPQSSPANTCIRIDSGQETPEVSRQPSSNGQEENDHCKVDSPTTSMAA